MKIKSFLIASMFSLNVFAGDAIVSWTYPTTYEDGTSLPVSEVTDVTIYYGQSSTGPYSSKVVVNPPATSTIITNLAKGTWYFTATITATNGLESAQSIIVNKSVLGNSKPKAPTLR
jgi:hypothetical protein